MPTQYSAHNQDSGIFALMVPGSCVMMMMMVMMNMTTKTAIAVDKA